MNNKPTLTIFAHTRDCGSYTYTVGDAEYDLELVTNGYVPKGLDIGGGDDVNLQIDIETGTIIGWDAEAVKAKLAEYVKQFDEDEDD